MRIFITGANRGLGLSLVSTLVRYLAKTESTHELYVIGRDSAALNAAMSPIEAEIPLNIELFQLTCAFSGASEMAALLGKLPNFDHVLHAASPYSRKRLSEASIEEIEEFSSFSLSESILLTETSKKLTLGGSVIATGAIIGEAISGVGSSPHRWYCGLSSVHKANLNVLMRCLAQEYGLHHRTIYANIGTFVEKHGNEARIEAGEVLATAEVADKLVTLALTDKQPSMQIDILPRAERIILDELRHVPRDIEVMDPVSIDVRMPSL